MDTIASFFHVYKVKNHKVFNKLCVQTTTLIRLVIYDAIRVCQVENLVTHGITYKAPYLSKAVMLRLLIIHFLY